MIEAKPTCLMCLASDSPVAPDMPRSGRIKFQAAVCVSSAALVCAAVDTVSIVPMSGSQFSSRCVASATKGWPSTIRTFLSITPIEPRVLAYSLVFP